MDAAKPERSELTAVLTGVVLNEAAAAVSLVFDMYNALSKTSSQVTKTFPMASADAAGLMPKESYAALTQAISDILALQQQGGRYIGQSFASRAALDAYIPTGINAGDFTFVLDDESKDDATARYIYDGSAFAFAYVINYDPVGLATAAVAGLVSGSADTDANAGRVFVESDGTMSVIGWDDLNTALAGKAAAVHTHTKSQITDFPLIIVQAAEPTAASTGDLWIKTS